MCPDCRYSDTIDQFDRRSKGDNIMFVCPKCDNAFEAAHSKISRKFTVQVLVNGEYNDIDEILCPECSESAIENFELINQGKAKAQVNRVCPVGVHIPEEQRSLEIEIHCKSCKTTFTENGLNIQPNDHYY